MTNLSTELTRLNEEWIGSHRESPVEAELLAKFITENLPTIIAALKAAETPLPEVAGRVESLRIAADLLGRQGNGDIAEKVKEAADLITAQARQLAERDAEIERLRRWLKPLRNT